MEEIKSAQSSISANEEKKAEAEVATSDAQRSLNKYEEKVRSGEERSNVQTRYAFVRHAANTAVAFSSQTSHLRNAASVKTQQAQTHLLESQTNLMKVEKDRRDGMSRVAEMESEIRSTEARMDQEELDAHNQVEAMIAQYRKLEDVVMTHQRTLKAALVV